jgi:hypothetical protein
VILALAGMRVYPGTPLFDAARRHDRCPAGADLLEPHFYFTPELTPEEVMTRMRAYSASASNWIVSEPSSEYHRLADRLRRKGVVGPLWSYLALIQRVLPRAP